MAQNRSPVEDPTAEQRKQDHIELSLQSALSQGKVDSRFCYEPLLSSHPQSDPEPVRFLDKSMRFPIWISSMTGGTKWARIINENLARVCHDFGLGMGLGSCRSLLYGEEYLGDFQVRKWIGEDLPFFANLGIAQVERLISGKETYRILDLLEKLQADGLIVHVNPMQEWLQPEGDQILQPPLETIKRLLDLATYPVIVKEVGQGMGPESLRELLALPLAAVDFAAFGGTNFSLLELLRAEPSQKELYLPLAHIGHTAEEMLDFVNSVLEDGQQPLCRQLIISGGVRNFLDGYYYISKSKLPALFGMASGFLEHARGDYDSLYRFALGQTQGWKLASAYLKVR